MRLLMLYDSLVDNKISNFLNIKHLIKYEKYYKILLFSYHFLYLKGFVLLYSEKWFHLLNYSIKIGFEYIYIIKNY